MELAAKYLMMVIKIVFENFDWKNKYFIWGEM